MGNNMLIELISKLDETKLVNQIESLRPTSLHRISIPKFKMEREYMLGTILSEMGMREVFTDKSDLSGLSVEKVKIDGSIHKALIEVDEEGTLAVAATRFYVRACLSFPISDKTFVADHPFMFLIRDKTNSITLFAGVVNKLKNAEPST